jgi:hypothetical protein
LQEELERLNKKRADREVEAALREEEEARMARLAESAMMENWVNKEDDFHLEQARRRAGIRMKENRAKAIDFLAINLRFAKPWEEDDKNDRDGDGGWGWAEAGLEMDLEEPYRIFEVSRLSWGGWDHLETGRLTRFAAYRISPLPTPKSSSTTLNSTSLWRRLPLTLTSGR